VSKAGGKLRLGPLPKTETVKLTVALSVELKATLDRYAELHARTWGEPVDAAALVPHMLAAFMERDRGFRSARRVRGTTTGAPAASVTNGQPTPPG
jgi:hypothetical protein